MRPPSTWLVNWDRLTTEFCFDLNSGGRIGGPRARPEGERGSSLSGYAARCGRHYALVYLYRSGIWLQVEEARYRLDDGSASFEHHHLLGPVVSVLSIDDGNRPTKIRNISLSRIWLPLIDPAYDDLDAEGEDFLRWVARHANDSRWVEWIRERWTPIENQKCWSAR